MTPRRLLPVVLAFAAALAVLLLWPKKASSPEEEIRALVAGCVRAANAHAVGDIADHLAEDFRGPQGARKSEVKQLLAYQLLRQGEVAVVFNPTLEVDVPADGQGHLVGHFVFGRVPAKSVDELPQGAVSAIYRIEANLARRDGQWIFVDAKYERATAW